MNPQLRLRARRSPSTAPYQEVDSMLNNEYHLTRRGRLSFSYRSAVLYRRTIWYQTLIYGSAPEGPHLARAGPCAPGEGPSRTGPMHRKRGEDPGLAPCARPGTVGNRPQPRPGKARPGAGGAVPGSKACSSLGMMLPNRADSTGTGGQKGLISRRPFGSPPAAASEPGMQPPGNARVI